MRPVLQASHPVGPLSGRMKGNWRGRSVNSFESRQDKIPSIGEDTSRGALPVDAFARMDLGDWWKELDLPIRWDLILQGERLNVEVGYGSGELLLSLAARNPKQSFIGIERYARGHRKLIAAARRKRLRNLISMVGDAYVLINIAFEDASLNGLTCKFADPWPKARHAKRRLYTVEFFSLVARKLRPGGRLALATDDRSYALQAADALASTPGLRSTHTDLKWLDESPAPLKTRYEEKWIAEGRPLHYFLYERRKQPCLT